MTKDREMHLLSGAIRSSGPDQLLSGARFKRSRVFRLYILSQFGGLLPLESGWSPILSKYVRSDHLAPPIMLPEGLKHN